jgi:hypothetical protein
VPEVGRGIRVVALVPGHVEGDQHRRHPIEERAHVVLDESEPAAEAERERGLRRQRTKPAAHQRLVVGVHPNLRVPLLDRAVDAERARTADEYFSPLVKSNYARYLQNCKTSHRTDEHFSCSYLFFTCI